MRSLLRWFSPNYGGGFWTIVRAGKEQGPRRRFVFGWNYRWDERWSGPADA